MTQDKDILTLHKELKDNPYSAPEGYFDSFRDKMAGRMPAEETSLWKRTVPYLAMAASFALLLTAGSLVLNKMTPDGEMSQEDFMIFSDNLINTYLYEDESSLQIADAELQNEDIIEYLIFTGISPEMIEESIK